MDEVSRTGGHVNFTIMTNLKTGRVVWIGDGKGRRGLLPLLRALGATGREPPVGHQHDVPLGLAEAINSKIGVLRFQARGYRYREYFKLKIFQRCSLPDNPLVVIVL